MNIKELQAEFEKHGWDIGKVTPNGFTLMYQDVKVKNHQIPGRFFVTSGNIILCADHFEIDCYEVEIYKNGSLVGTIEPDKVN